MALAAGNEILISSTTADLLDGSGLALQDCGLQELKGVPGRRQVFEVVGRPLE